MNAPLTDAQLAEIESTVPTIAPGPWRLERDNALGEWVVWSAEDDPVLQILIWGSEIGPFVETCRTTVPALLAEVRRLRALVNPDTWTAPDGTVLDLARPVLDRDGAEWVLDEVPLLTVAMADGDLDARTLPELFRRYGPLTQADAATRPEPTP